MVQPRHGRRADRLSRQRKVQHRPGAGGSTGSAVRRPGQKDRADEAGLSIKDIFAAGGEPQFRELESAALQDAIRRPDAILALGGGALVRPANRTVLAEANHMVVYSRCEPEALLARIRGDPATAANRPNLTALGGGIDEVKKLLAEREPVYRAAMTFELDVTNLSIQQAVQEIAGRLEHRLSQYSRKG